MSTLHGVIQRLRDGRRLDDDQIDELERLLIVLEGEGWAGVLSADAAARILVQEAHAHD